MEKSINFPSLKEKKDINVIKRKQDEYKILIIIIIPLNSSFNTAPTFLPLLVTNRL